MSPFATGHGFSTPARGRSRPDEFAVPVILFYRNILWTFQNFRRILTDRSALMQGGERLAVDAEQGRAGGEGGRERQGSATDITSFRKNRFRNFFARKPLIFLISAK